MGRKPRAPEWLGRSPVVRVAGSSAIIYCDFDTGQPCCQTSVSASRSGISLAIVAGSAGRSGPWVVEEIYAFCVPIVRSATKSVTDVGSTFENPAPNVASFACWLGFSIRNTTAGIPNRSAASLTAARGFPSIWELTARSHRKALLNFACPSARLRFVCPHMPTGTTPTQQRSFCELKRLPEDKSHLDAPST